MKKLLFIIPLGLSLTVLSCSNHPEQTITEETVTEVALAPKTETSVEQNTKGSIVNVDVKQFEKGIKQGEINILDVRTPEEWENGIIKGATKMNFYDKDFKEQLAKLDKTKPVFVYCKSGGRSGKAAKELAKSGYTVFNLLGGITAWTSAGKETVK